MSNVDHPKHYNTGCSVITRPALAEMGIEDFDDECIEVLELSHGTQILGDAYLAQAVIYLWRCEHKDSRLEDLQKAAWWMRRGLNFWSYAPELESRIRRCLAGTESLITKLKS